jgi:hypothetical protein
MAIHGNVRTTRRSRTLMVQRLAGGWCVAAVAVAQGVTTQEASPPRLGANGASVTMATARPF